MRINNDHYRKITLVLCCIIALKFEFVLRVSFPVFFKESLIFTQFLVVYFPPYVLYKLLVHKYK